MARPRRTTSPHRSVGVHVIGVADVGSNTTHLLVGVTDGEQIEPLLDLSVSIDLGVAVERRGKIGKELAMRVADALLDFRERARALGAEGLAIVATEPLRRASDRIEVARRIAARYGASIAALSHEEEGLLALLGLRSEHDRSRSLVVADIGGGSTEIVVLSPGRSPRAFGVAIGSATLGGGEALADPPRPRGWRLLQDRAEAALLVAGAVRGDNLVLAGGTAQSLLRLLPTALIARCITVDDLAPMREILSSYPAERVAAEHGISPRRARLLPSGLVIAEALMRRVEVESAKVDRGGIREGLLIAIARNGAAWRERLPHLAARRFGD